MSFNLTLPRWLLPAVALLVTSLVRAETLTVYTYDSFISEWGPGPKLEPLFEKECQCDLKFVGVEDGVSILNRLRIEKDNTRADVILGIDDGLMEEARQTGLLQPHQIKTDAVAASLNWQDPVFVPFDYGYFAFVYDSRKISQPASSMAELLGSGASIIYQDPRTSTPGQGLMIWMNAIYGDQVTSAWEKLAAQTVTVTKGWWEAYSMFLEGGADYVLSYNTSPAYHLVAEGKDQYRAALFEEGHIAQIEVAAITASTKQPELARAFVQFLLSAKAQEVIPVTNWMLPVREGVTLPDAFGDLISPKVLKVTPEDITRQRQDWIRTWRNAVSR